MSRANQKIFEMTGWEVACIYKRIFDTVDGQLMLEDLNNRCHINTPIPFGEEGQRAEGMRSVVLHINSQINMEENKESSYREEEIQ